MNNEEQEIVLNCLQAAGHKFVTASEFVPGRKFLETWIGSASQQHTAHTIILDINLFDNVYSSIIKLNIRTYRYNEKKIQSRKLW